VNVDEQQLGELRWIVLRGPAEEAFGALGRHMRTQIREIVADWPELARLRRHAASGLGSQRLAAVRRASVAAFPQVWAELAALADGAGVPLDDLALLNLRGDIGRIGGDSGGECSDLAWRRRRSIIAHNEDESDFYGGRCVLLTLAPKGQQPVTAFWKPGFLPGGTFTVTGAGLVWAIDHLPVGVPGEGAGRQFAAWELHRAAGTVGQAIGYLRGHPTAGGFSYTVGDAAGRVAIVESAAGRLGVTEVGAGNPLAWHTNHGRYVTGAGASPHGTSLVRGEVLQALETPAGEPDTSWFTGVLAEAAPPRGVRADPSPAGTSATLCTFVADLTAGAAVILPRGAGAVTIPLADLAQGRAAAGLAS
jgi:Acyl-coenzyme A:6-aminopenicillanic acid acyl-transferase